MKAIHGKFDGKVIVLDDPSLLKVDQDVVVLVEDAGVGAAHAGVVAFDRELDELFAKDTHKLPPLPASLSRADIYADHD